MNDLSNNQSPNIGLPIGQSQRSIKLLTFSVGKLNVALPVDLVKKVVNYTPIYGSGLSHLGVARIDDREITVVDLHKRLFNASQLIPSGSRGYLIIARNSVGESFGILVGQAPSLHDVPISQIRALPASYRRADTLEIASHVTVISHKEESLTVFILEVDRIVPPVSGIISASPQLSFPF
ncbi:chemotaxis signal transduction protein [Pleurocapsa sp. PCC 7327]|uniref:chemotaxis protein CheW n=1 Tax=Pleurocapsa sp. PCC 7327 TaxID=118163 RepID=UPI00029FB405|nr:CheW domain-containing protein [Pleurocapsa sp. PCC 7327]AFY77713.1 chemotaxis signal transduction protein [Pleurocapsa sp. PCC 7327]